MSRGGRSVVPSLALALGAALLYLLLPSRNYQYADDSLRWAYHITRSHELINGHHLYLNAMSWIYHLAHGLGIALAPTDLLAGYSALCGGFGLFFLHRLIDRAGAGRLATFGVLVCAFSAGYWCYSIVGDVYVPATAFLLAGLYGFDSALRAEDPSRAWRAAGAAVLAFVVMLLHHQAHLAFVAGLFPATLPLRAIPVRRRLAVSLAIPALVAVVTLGIYAGVYSSRPAAERHGFVRFFSGYAVAFDARPDQKRLTLGSIVNEAAGETRALFSTNVMFRSARITHAIQTRYPYRNVYPYPYLVRNMPVGVAALVVAAVLIGAILAGVLLVRGVIEAIRGRDLALLVVIAALPQILFFMWWEGISDEFSIWTVPLLALVMTVGARAAKRGGRLLGGLAAACFVSTWFGSVLPFASASNDLDSVNDRYVSRLGPQDVLIGFDGLQSNYRVSLARDRQGFEYHNLGESAARWSPADSLALERWIADAEGRGKTIHVSPRILHPANSDMEFLRLLNPHFEEQRRSIIQRLGRIPRVDFVAPVALPAGFFRNDS